MERGEGGQKGQHGATAVFGTDRHELKLGKSFQKDNNGGFHTIRYDFKPASVDRSKEAVLDVGETNEVTITLPNIENKNKGPESTVYGGSKKPYQKECVLIFDHRTGEFTLERLSCNINVKRQRQEGSSKVQLPAKKPLQSLSKNSPNARSASGSKKKDTSTPTHSPAPPPEVKVERSPAPQPSPLAVSEPSPAPQSVPSVTDHKDDDSSDNYMSSSDSEDDNDSSSSSGSSQSSSDEETEVKGVREVKDTRWSQPQHQQHQQKKRPDKPSHHQSHVQAPSRQPKTKPVHVNPGMSQLSEDLRLSSSGSDSDSD